MYSIIHQYALAMYVRGTVSPLTRKLYFERIDIISL